MKLLKWLASTWVRVPILGQLHLAKAGDYSEAFKELIPAQVISTLPIWVGGIVIYVSKFNDSYVSYWRSVLNVCDRGELFIYAAATAAPLIYLAIKDRKGIKGFPGKFTFVVIAIACAVLAVVMMSIERMSSGGRVPQPMIIVSGITFLVSLVAVYLAFVFNNTLLPNPSEMMREGERHFSELLSKHRP